MHHAAARGHSALIDLLLERGADRNAQAKAMWWTLVLGRVRLLSQDGFTALHLASAGSGHPTAIECLLMAGADALIPNQVHALMPSSCSDDSLSLGRRHRIWPNQRSPEKCLQAYGGLHPQPAPSPHTTRVTRRRLIQSAEGAAEGWVAVGSECDGTWE